jgi:hypothetical protein
MFHLLKLAAADAFLAGLHAVCLLHLHLHVAYDLHIFLSGFRIFVYPTLWARNVHPSATQHPESSPRRNNLAHRIGYWRIQSRSKHQEDVRIRLTFTRKEVRG